VALGLGRHIHSFSTTSTDDVSSDDQSKSKHTIFSTPTLGGHGQRVGGFADRQAREDEALRLALENDLCAQAKMVCIASQSNSDSAEYEQAFLRLMRHMVNATELSVCATESGITPFISYGSWRDNEGDTVKAVRVIVFTNEQLAKMHGPTLEAERRPIAGTELFRKLASLAPHTPGDFAVDLNGVFQFPFPNKEVGAWMTSRRNGQLLSAIATQTQSFSEFDLLGDCSSQLDVANAFMANPMFQVFVRDEPLVIRRDSHGIVLPIFSAPALAISFLHDILGNSDAEVNSNDVSIRTTTGEQVVEQFERRDETSNWIGGLCLDPLPESELVYDDAAEVFRRNELEPDEILLTRRDMSSLFKEEKIEAEPPGVFNL